MPTYKYALAHAANWSAMTGTTTKMTDGSVNDTTTAEGQQSSGASTVDITVICDLGSAQAVSRIQTTYGACTGGSGTWAASNDGSSWTTLHSLAGNGADGDDVTYKSEDSNTVGGATGTAYRYWRVTLQNVPNSDDCSAAYISDFRLTVASGAAVSKALVAGGEGMGGMTRAALTGVL